MASKQHVQIEGKELIISNVGKVLFPGNGYTKGQVISFYSEIAWAILPHLKDRPLTLKRYPDGVTAEHFYEKNAPAHTPKWVKRFAMPRTEGGEHIHYVLCNDLPTLVWVTNLADIEKHVLLAMFRIWTGRHRLSLTWTRVSPPGSWTAARSPLL